VAAIVNNGNENGCSASLLLLQMGCAPLPNWHTQNLNNNIPKEMKKSTRKNSVMAGFHVIIIVA